MKTTTQSGCVRKAGRRGLSLMALAGVAMLITPALVAATNTVSAPAGVVRILVPPNSEAMLSAPLVPFNPDINAVFSNQLTGATNMNVADVIRQWNVAAQTYTNAYKADGTGDAAKNGRWFNDFSGWTTSTLSFTPGKGFWVANRQSSTQTVFLSGSVVPDSQVLLTLAPGTALVGFPFSSKVALNDTTLRNDGARGGSSQTNADQISDLLNGSYVTSWLLNNTNSANHGKWVDASTNLSSTVLLPGRGYWYQRVSTNSLAWRDNRPYAYSFPTNGNPPSIGGMTLNAGKDEVTLLAVASGTTGEKLDVFFKDLAQTNAFSSTGWQIAAMNLTPSGAALQWTDAGSAARSKINTVFSRYYLIGRADVDTDGDGVPDSRETFIYGSNPNANDLTVLPFAENFETNTVTLGDLNGQNKWTASPSGACLVQSSTAYQGQRALQFNAPTGQTATASHTFVMSGQNVIWLDMRAQVKWATPAAGTPDAVAAFHFDANGRLVVYDGLQSGATKWVTLASQAPTGSWARVSVKLDYATRKWAVCLNGQSAASDLGFASVQTEFTRLAIAAGKGYADAISITTNAPADLTVDWDSLPNAWELQYFGNLDQADDADPDADGLTNLDEYRLGTNPTVNDRATDSDGDGRSNYDEVMFYGTDPSLADSDGDGMSDGVEVSAGKNPLVADQGNTGGPTVTVLSPANNTRILW